MKDIHQIELWVERVIRSCKTAEQIEVAFNLVKNFKKYYPQNDSSGLTYLLFEQITLLRYGN